MPHKRGKSGPDERHYRMRFTELLEGSILFAVGFVLTVLALVALT